MVAADDDFAKIDEGAAFPQGIPHRWPRILDEDREAVAATLLAGDISYYASTKEVDLLEAKFKDYIGVNYAIALNSGTSALHMAYLSANLGEGDEVLVPNYTFPATIMPLLHSRAKPVLVDTTAGYPFPSVVEFAAKLSPKTKALVVTHMDGIPAPMDEIVRFAQRHNLFVIEDCAQAMGASRKGKRVGSYGDVGVFSLTDKKIVVGGEGGVLTTNRRDIYERIILFSYLQKRAQNELTMESYKRFWYTGLGFNLRIHPFAAALACSQFDRIEANLNARENTLKRLSELLQRFPELETPQFEAEIVKGHYSFKFLYRGEKLGIDEYVARLQLEGIPVCRSQTTPMHMTDIFQEAARPFLIEMNLNPYFTNSSTDFPHSTEYFNRSLRLPPLYELSDDDFVKIGQAFEKASRLTN